jgi:hypothetical protein
MSRSAGGGAPAWLFSFVDLTSFLTLVMLAQVDPHAGSAPELGEFEVPRIARESGAELTERAAERWQLRVHPPDPVEPPFELVRGEAEGSERLAEAELGARLASLRDAAAARPLLTPHEDSRSRDLLAAASLLEVHWPGPRFALVDRALAQR